MRSLKCVLVLVLIMSLASCGNKRVVDVELPESAPEVNLTTYTKALYELGRMTRKFGISKTYVQSKGVVDDTGTSMATGGEIPFDITEMVKTSVNRIGGNIVFVPYDPVFLKNQAGLNFTSLEGKAKPDVVISGGITQFDRSLEGGQNGFDAGGSFNDAGIELSSQDRDSTSSIGLDLNLIDFDTMSMLPRVQAVNSMKVYKVASDKEVGFSILGAAFGFKGGVKKIQGRHAAVRVLVELSVVELIGKYLTLPYWKCIPGSVPDPIVLETIRDQFNEADNTERMRMVQQLLRVYGFKNIRQTGILDEASKKALNSVIKAYGIDSTNLNDRFYQALFENAPASSYERSKISFEDSKHSGLKLSTLTAASPPALSKAKVITSSDDLKVTVRTNKRSYKLNESIQIEFVGNKDFYGKLIYSAVDGSLVQLLPNMYNSRDHFKAGQKYTVPGPEDQFQLTISPPFGEERILLYASESPLQSIDTVPAGQGLSTIPENLEKMENKVRAVSLSSRKPKAQKFDAVIFTHK